MNKDNAEGKGKWEGASYQRQQRSLHVSLGGEYFLPREEYERQGRMLAQSTIRSPKTRELYIKGWNAAWEEPKPIEHNPNSRFCSCPECMKGD